MRHLPGVITLSSASLLFHSSPALAQTEEVRFWVLAPLADAMGMTQMQVALCLLVLVTLLWLWVQLSQLGKERRFPSYVQTQGRITNVTAYSTLLFFSVKRVVTHHFTYTVQGQELSGKWIQIRKMKEEPVLYEIGQAATVHYDPDKPRRAALSLEKRPAARVALGLASALAILVAAVAGLAVSFAG